MSSGKRGRQGDKTTKKGSANSRKPPRNRQRSGAKNGNAVPVEAGQVTVRRVWGMFKDFLTVFRDPLAWALLIMGFIFATKALEVIKALRRQPPVFYFLKDLFDSVGGLISVKESGFRYLKRIPAIVYQLVIPMLFIWLVTWLRERNAGANSGLDRVKLLFSSFLQGAREYGFSWSHLKQWRRLLVLIFLVMLPFIFFYGSSPSFKSQYPYLHQLRTMRTRQVQQKKQLEQHNKKLPALVDRSILPASGRREQGNLFEHLRSGSVLQKKINDLAGATLWLFLLFEFIRGFYMLSWEFLFRGFMLNAFRPKFGYYAIFLQMIPYVMLHATKPSLELYYTIPSALLLGLLAWVTKSVWPGFFLHFFGAVLFDFTAMFL